MSEFRNCYSLAPNGNEVWSILRHLPIGVFWDAYRMTQKNAHRLFKAFSLAYRDMSCALCRLATELNPFTTEQLIGEWERALGLPDPCLPDAPTLEERRAWIIWRLAKRRWTTAADWIELAALFGMHIEITPGWLVQKPALYAFTYPKRYDIFPKLGRFRVYIDVIGLTGMGYDYGTSNRGPGYPIPYGITNAALSRFQCLIERVKPANVVIIWNNNPLRYGCYAETFEETFSDTFCSSSMSDW
jgi:uncharacterized protein YmfQ (DUF2313 family)